MSLTKHIINKARSIKNRILEWVRISCATCITFVLRTHVRRWRKVAHAGPPPWDERNKIIAGFIPAGRSVLDIGCGARTLRQYLPPSCKYQPCDIIRSSPEVIFCDFNSGIYPDIEDRFDYVVCSGVFEYMRKPQEFLTRISQFGDVLFVSYYPWSRGSSKLARYGNNWVNHFTRDELENLFSDQGLRWKVSHTSDVGYLIYSLYRNQEKPL